MRRDGISLLDDNEIKRVKNCWLIVCETVRKEFSRTCLGAGRIAWDGRS